MRKFTFGSICMAIAMAFNLSLKADEPVVGEVVHEPIAATCDAGCCCNSGGWLVDLEATFFRFHRTDGVQVLDDQVEFDFEIAPRVTVGYVDCDGLGVRARWWDYNHVNHSDANPDICVGVDTFTLDLEVFESLQLGCLTRLEWSAGVRYVDYTEEFVDGGAIIGASTFTGPGVVLGLQINRCTKFGGEVYARARGSILQSDQRRNDPLFFDVSNTISELGVGYQVSRCLCSGAVLNLRAGVEMQQWSNFSIDGNAGHDEIASDVGFGGFVIGAGLNY